MVLDEEALPLQRAWCLFEVFRTFRLCRERSKEDWKSQENATHTCTERFLISIDFQKVHLAPA